MNNIDEKWLWGIHTTDDYLFLKQHVIAIGWKELGDLSKLPDDKEALKAIYQKTYPGEKKGSMQNLFFLPFFRINEVPTQENINEIAKTIMRFRGKVIHDGEKSTFSDEETPYVRFLEILVYSMILKRVGIPDKGIELITGVIFHCNYAAMEQK